MSTGKEVLKLRLCRERERGGGEGGEGTLMRLWLAVNMSLVLLQ